MAGRRTSIKPSVRQARIVELVSQQSAVTVEDLAESFNISPETIRRDLSVLADAGRIRKVHGGARAARLQDEGPFEERMQQNALAKQLIAEKVARFVSPNQTIFLDTGSTTLMCAKALTKVEGLTVVTNSCRIAATFAGAGNGANVYLLGGQYRADNAQTVGAITVEEVGRYNADCAILTVSAIDERGAMDFSHEEAQVARAMIASSSRLAVVADSAKFNKRTVFNVCELSQIDNLFVDSPPSDEGLVDALSAAEVEVL